MLSRDEIKTLEELNFNAWPALRTAQYDGWILRCTGGPSRRVNSVNPFWPGQVELAGKIEVAEAIYARWGRRAVFRLTPLADEGLDETLAACGYVVEAPSLVQVADAAPYQSSPKILLRERPDEVWLAAARELRGLSGDDAAHFDSQHRAVGVETRWALFVEAGQAVGAGVVAVERQWAGLHGIYVAHKARRRGVARMVSESLIGAAHGLGARRVWLQVEQGNTAARPLYAALGFGTAYAYHYRVWPG